MKRKAVANGNSPNLLDSNKSPEMGYDNKETDILILLHIFPEEVWHLILANVDTYQDYHRISSTSPPLKQWLKPKSTQILFEPVAKIMLNLYLNTASPESNNEMEEDSVDSTGWQKVDILPLRQVCRAWQRGVDNVLQNLDIYFMNTSEYTTVRNTQFLFDFRHFSTKLGDLEEIQELNEKFKESHSHTKRNPLVTRYIEITIQADEEDHPEDLNVYLAELVKCLEKYGEHVWYCKMLFELETSRDHIKAYKELPKILNLLPNLKVFSFDSSSCHRLPVKKLNELQKFIKLNPIPRLKDLQRIYNECMVLPVFTSLLEQNRHIRNIEIPGTTTDKHVQICLETVSNLNNFSVNLDKREEFYAFQTAKVKCRLVKLDITIYFYTSWSLIFDMLKTQFGETLQEFKIALPKAKPADARESLELPKLKKLELDLRKPEQLDFLLPMKGHLEYLSVMVEGDKKSFQEAVKKEGGINIYRFRNELLKSNAWNLFPKLKEILFDDGNETKVYHRNKLQLCINPN